MDEIIEMPGLERGVLPVVREREQFVACAFHAGGAPKQGSREHGSCAGAGFTGQRRELGKLQFAAGIKLAAIQAQRKRRGLPPHLDSPGAGHGEEITVGTDPHGLRHAVAPRRFQPAIPVAPFVRDAILAPIVLQRGEHEITGLRAVLNGVHADGMGAI